MSKKLLKTLKQQPAAMKPQSSSSSSSSETGNISQEEVDTSDDEELRQCYGPSCLKAAIPNSKYCSSDSCGRELAILRLTTILPQRVASVPCRAELNNRQDLNLNCEKQKQYKEEIVKLEARRVALDAQIDFSQRLTVDLSENHKVQEEEGTISCVTCGLEVPAKTCMKHMDRCFGKYEARMTFASGFKSELPGTPIFCDYFDSKNKTYCKRLKVLCPEHTKPGKVSSDAVCGCPLTTDDDIIMEPTNTVCKVPKQKCDIHHGWEKLRRSQVDMKKVQCYLKLEELLIEEKKINQALYDRQNVFGLLFHSTTDHELELDRIDKMQTVTLAAANEPIEMDSSASVMEEGNPSTKRKRSKQKNTTEQQEGVLIDLTGDAEIGSEEKEVIKKQKAVFIGLPDGTEDKKVTKKKDETVLVDLTNDDDSKIQETKVSRKKEKAVSTDLPGENKEKQATTKEEKAVSVDLPDKSESKEKKVTLESEKEIIFVDLTEEGEDDDDMKAIEREKISDHRRLQKQPQDLLQKTEFGNISKSGESGTTKKSFQFKRPEQHQPTAGNGKKRKRSHAHSSSSATSESSND